VQQRTAPFEIGEPALGHQPKLEVLARFEKRVSVRGDP
jgi:type II secretory pathway predicted ATPase ExeA